MVTRSTLDKIVSVIADTVHPDKIILFGSYARGDATAASDLDLLVIKESTLPRHKRSREIRKALWGVSDVPKDILVYTSREIDEWRHVESAFISRAVATGRVVYEKPD